VVKNSFPNLRLEIFPNVSLQPLKQLRATSFELLAGNSLRDSSSVHFLTAETVGLEARSSQLKAFLTMSKLHFTTKHANEATVKRNWYVVDGTNQTVGRMCARIAAILRGKNKAYYTPHVDTGDYIVVINCEKVVFTGNKLEQKVYDTYSGYPGGRKEETAANMQKRRPEVVIERAVKGMLPRNRLGRKMYKKLFVYVGEQHPHTAQQPKELKF
jgi:large subunit ribosomal protein L13